MKGFITTFKDFFGKMTCMSIDERYEPYLEWLESEKEEALKRLITWANTSSYTHDLEGLKKQQQLIIQDFEKIADTTQILEVPKAFRITSDGKKEPYSIAPALSFQKRAQAHKKIFLGGHIDTVHKNFFPVVQKGSKLFGPGVADMKGGLMVLLKALEAFERSPFASEIGWEVFINSDEEIGSPSSGPIIRERARLYPVSLWFEPAIDEGFLAGRRKGSINITLVFNGFGGHAGRDFDKGKNALLSTSRFIYALEERKHPTLNINYGELHSGQGHNVIPNQAILKINARSFEPNALDSFIRLVDDVIDVEEKHYGIHIEVFKETLRPPKELPIDLFKSFRKVGEELGINIDVKDTGGVSDGNLISAAHSACIDNLGVIGGSLHTQDEWMDIESLIPRSKLTLLYLMEAGSTHGH